MTSTLLPIGRFQKSNSAKRQVSAQELLTLTDTVFKYGVLRKRGKKLNIGKWPRRFVILTYDSVYVYDNEHSAIPKTKFGLIGYNQVVRCEFKGQNWCFSVVPADNGDCAEVKTFACTSDTDRKEWMKAIKNQMYPANSITKPAQTRADRLRSPSNSADEYTSLETLVYSPIEGIHHTREENDFDNDDGDENSNGSFDSCSGKSNGSTSKIKRQSTANSEGSSSDSSSHNYEPYDDKFLVEGPLKSPSDTKKRIPKDPPPTPPLDAPQSSCNGNKKKQCSPSLPHSNKSLNIEQEESNIYVNANVCNQPATLESLCTITDPALDRAQLINMLLQRNECGTYIIRQSRQSDQKVIAILSEDYQVKEYKIYGTADRQTLDQKEFFKNTNQLLRHYTEVEPLPKSTEYLKQGFYKNTRR
ncbi:hypothetical protein BsWGS_27222 [Bradybaena similaris]